MTTADTAFERLRRANPEPDPDALLALIDAADDLGGMRLNSPSSPVVQPEYHAPWVRHLHLGWAALATFGFGLVVALALLLIVNRSGPVAWFQPTPIEIAERYFEAYNHWDAEAVKAVLAVDATLVGPRWEVEDLGGVSWLDGLSQVIEYNRIVGLTYTPDRCVEAGIGEPVTVACEYQVDSVFQQAAGTSSLTGRLFFHISGSLILSGSDNFPAIEYAESWNQWRLWLSEKHPDDYELLIGTSPDRPGYYWFSIPVPAMLTPEMLALLEDRIAEYADR